jgi:hypothetical protein
MKCEIVEGGGGVVFIIEGGGDFLFCERKRYPFSFPGHRNVHICRSHPSLVVAICCYKTTIRIIGVQCARIRVVCFFLFPTFLAITNKPSHSLSNLTPLQMCVVRVARNSPWSRKDQTRDFRVSEHHPRAIDRHREAPRNTIAIAIVQ